MVFAAMNQRGGTDWRPGNTQLRLLIQSVVFLRLCLFVINADFYWRAQRIRWSMQSSVNHKLKGKLKYEDSEHYEKNRPCFAGINFMRCITSVGSQNSR